MKVGHSFLLGAFLVHEISASCDPSPAFPVPSWEENAEVLKPALRAIGDDLERIVSKKYDTSSFSIELTSGTELLWSKFHTAPTRNETRPGVKEVDGNSLYRIASISKVFTTLGLLYQHQAGNLSLDDPITKYVPNLSGAIPWKSITLRILASQLSGIPREFAQGDYLNILNDPTMIGLPPANKEQLPTCDEYNDYKPCKAADLIEHINQHLLPLFAPNQESTYSNLNYELIGLAIENATGLEFTDYIRQAIFKPLKMSSSTFKTPSDKHAVLPLGNNYWDVDAGVQNPTGGIYSSSSDMIQLVRYILNNYNGIATGVNWLMPGSWTTGMNTFYGMPFEIFRTDSILEESRRPVTFVTKAGGLPGYFSRIYIMPEYGLGLTVLVAGESSLLTDIDNAVTVPLVRKAEEEIWKVVDKTYTGTYIATDPSLKSLLKLSSSSSGGLVIDSFISNDTVVLDSDLVTKLVDRSIPGWRVQLVPTLLFKNESSKQGEIWRFIGVSGEKDATSRRAWDDFCIMDIDIGLYAGLPVNEVVFWHEQGVVELPAWKVKMKAVDIDDESPGMTIQQ